MPLKKAGFAAGLDDNVDFTPSATAGTPMSLPIEEGSHSVPNAVRNQLHVFVWHLQILCKR
jgi:hypothetical protein